MALSKAQAERREKWLETRNGVDGYLGASELAAVCGLSNFETPHSVYLKKKGLLEVDDTLSMRRGRYMESFIVQLYCEHFNIPLIEARPARTFRHPEHRFIGATPDRLIQVDGVPTVLECKDVGEFQAHKFGASGTDEVADEYLIQVAVQMACTRRPRARLAAFIKGREFRWYDFRADSPQIEAITERAVEEGVSWWLNYFLKDVPPPLTGYEPDVVYSRSAYEPDGSVMFATPELEAVCAQYLPQKEIADAAELEKNRLQNEIICGMQGAAVLETSQGNFTFKPNKNGVKSFRAPKARNSA